MSIIKVENLSKKYIIGHDRAASGAFKYQSLRDSMTHWGRGLYQRLRHPLSPNRESTELEEFWALKDINFEIQQGDRVGIIGRNGAGKSTLLKILSRITEPTTGKITMNGRVASLLEVGTGFHPELTGRENIYLNGAILGMSRIEIKKKFDEIVAFAEVEKFLDTPVKHYSSGMYVRLAFAVAAHLEPEILLVDEVLAVGDAQFQKKCLGKMEDVSKEGRTIIFVSHNMGMISQLCSIAILLKHGRLEYICDTNEVINKYISNYHDLMPCVIPRNNNNKTIFFTKIECCDCNNFPKNQFKHDELIRIAITCQLISYTNGTCISIVIKNSMGVKIFTGEKELPISKNTTEYFIKVDIPKKLLVPGNYFVSCFLYVPNAIIFDKQDDINSFSIEETGSPLLKYSGTDYGVIFADLNWDVYF